MKKSLLKVLSLFFVLGLMSGQSMASSDDIRLGRPGYGGNGCPAGRLHRAVDY